MIMRVIISCELIIPSALIQSLEVQIVEKCVWDKSVNNIRIKSNMDV